MTHPRQQIRAAVVAKLVAANTAAGARVFKTRVAPLRKGNLPALLVFTLTEPSEARGGIDSREYKRSLELVVTGVIEAGDDVDDALDALAKQIECALHTDSTFGLSFVDDAQLTNTEMDVDKIGDQAIGALQMTYSVTYYTPAVDTDCAPVGDDFTAGEAKWSIDNAQAPADQKTNDFDVP